jgi:hypothetical protein
MFTSTHRNLSHLLLAGAVALGGCAPGDQYAPHGGDGEGALSRYEEIFSGAPDNETLPDENKADAQYPPRFTDLVASQSPVKSQGSRGVCSIFSSVAHMEHLYILAGDPDPDFSEQYLQWSAKFQVGSFRNSSGSNANFNLQAISQYGIPVEEAWPYESFPWGPAQDPECDGEEKDRPTRCHTNGTPPESALDADKFKLPRGRWLNTNSIKAHMTSRGTAVEVGLDFFYQSWNHRLSTLPTNNAYWRKGYVLYPNARDVEESHKQRAGHSILLVGWDEDLEVPIVDEHGAQVLDADGNPVTEKGFYIFKNSWGNHSFGVDNPHGAGYGFISRRYVERHGTAYVVSGLPEVEPPPTPPPAEAEEYTKEDGQAIPDRTPAGITSEILVPTSGAVGTVAVTVDITHTYIGDLTVRLRKGDRVATLHNRSGGSDDDIQKTYVVTDFDGVERNGAWVLEVADHAAWDVGTLNTWSLKIE